MVDSCVGCLIEAGEVTYSGRASILSVPSFTVPGNDEHNCGETAKWWCMCFPGRRPHLCVWLGAVGGGLRKTRQRHVPLSVCYHDTYEGFRHRRHGVDGLAHCRAQPTGRCDGPFLAGATG